MPHRMRTSRMFAVRRWSRYVALISTILIPTVLFGMVDFHKKGHRKKAHRHTPPVKVVGPIVDYALDVKPIFAAHCYSCHGPKRHRAGLRLDTIAGLRKGGDSGAVIVPGDAVNSLLFAAVSGV